MPRPNLSSLISDEMKKRFEAAITGELAAFDRRHQDYIDRIDRLEKTSQNAIQDMKEEAKTFSLFWNKNQKSYDEFQVYIHQLQRDQAHEIKRIVKEVEKKLDQFHAEKKEFLRLDNVQSELRDHLDSMTQIISTASKDMEMHKHEWFEEWKRIEVGVNRELDRIYRILNKNDIRMNKLEKNLMTFRVDSEGILRELQVYKKSMFIMEKKIEDLYDKLGRMK